MSDGFFHNLGGTTENLYLRPFVITMGRRFFYCIFIKNYL